MSVDPADVPPPPADRAVIDRARAGDREALGAIYDTYLLQVYRYVYSRVGNASDAEDITEEVFVRVVENIARFQWHDVPFTAWLFRIAHNQVVSHHRRRAARPAAVSTDEHELDMEDTSPGPEAAIEHIMTVREVADACERLPDAQRRVISLRFAAGLSVKETAEALGKTENNVKVLQHKAIARLQKLLRPR